MSIKSTYKKDNFLIIELEGRIDIQVADNVGDTISELIDKGETNLIFDLKNLKFMDSSGLRIFIGIKRHLDTVSGILKLANLKKNIFEIFEIVELDKMFNIYKDIKKALASN